jgi:glycosyltransferase involved in cell wall biosynthesis
MASAPSAFVADYIHDSCRVNHPIDIIPYPVDTARFTPGKERQQPPIVLFVGRVERRKGADILLRAIAAVRKNFLTLNLYSAGSPAMN